MTRYWANCPCARKRLCQVGGLVSEIAEGTTCRRIMISKDWRCAGAPGTAICFPSKTGDKKEDIMMGDKGWRFPRTPGTIIRLPSYRKRDERRSSQETRTGKFLGRLLDCWQAFSQVSWTTSWPLTLWAFGHVLLCCLPCKAKPARSQDSLICRVEKRQQCFEFCVVDKFPKQDFNLEVTSFGGHRLHAGAAK